MIPDNQFARRIQSKKGRRMQIRVWTKSEQNWIFRRNFLSKYLSSRNLKLNFVKRKIEESENWFYIIFITLRIFWDQKLNLATFLGITPNCSAICWAMVKIKLLNPQPVFGIYCVVLTSSQVQNMIMKCNTSIGTNFVNK